MHREDNTTLGGSSKAIFDAWEKRVGDEKIADAANAALNSSAL